MVHIHRIQSEEILKVLGNATRLDVLRLLMKDAATISQLGETLQKHPAQIRNHIKQLEDAGLVELITIRTVKNYTEKYYQATARAFFINMAILPTPTTPDYFVVLGSDELALNTLADYLQQQANTPSLYVLPGSSLEGLLYLREKYCHLAGCHLWDSSSGDYNLTYVHSLFLDCRMVLVTLAHRQQGLLVQKGNPSDIHGIPDLNRADVRLINHRRGSATRLLLDQQLKEYAIFPESVNGYLDEAASHHEVSAAISSGLADTGMGVHTSAEEAGLDFIPLLRERFDLVMESEIYENPRMGRIVEHIQSADFRRQIDHLSGYESTHTGEILHL